MTAELFAYWEGLRAGRLVPARSDIDPRGIEDALDHAFIIERMANQIARFRIAGMHLGDHVGMDVRGMPLTSLFTPASRPEVSAAVERVFNGPEILALSVVSSPSTEGPSLTGKLLLLPLRSDLGDITRALGCLVTEGEIGPRPQLLSAIEARFSPIEAGRPVLPPVAVDLASLRALAHSATTGLAEPARPYEPASARRLPEARPTLRLVVSDGQRRDDKE